MLGVWEDVVKLCLECGRLDVVNKAMNGGGQGGIVNKAMIGVEEGVGGNAVNKAMTGVEEGVGGGMS